MNTVTVLKSLAVMLALSAFVSCGGGSASSAVSQGDTLSLDYARLLTIVTHEDFTEVSVSNPWDSTKY